MKRKHGAWGAVWAGLATALAGLGCVLCCAGTLGLAGLTGLASWVGLAAHWAFSTWMVWAGGALLLGLLLGWLMMARGWVIRRRWARLCCAEREEKARPCVCASRGQ